MRDEESGGDVWSNLKTVSTFDDGDNENNDSGGGGGAMGMAVKKRKEFGRFSPSSLLVESLIEQLCKMMENDPTHQKTLYLMICDKLHRMKLIDTSYHMDEFEFMRSHYQRALYNLLTVAKAAKSNRDLSGGSSGNSPSATAANVFYPKVPSLKLDLELTPGKVLEWSRYANEFVELEFIAKGGFGQVYKARHKLDSTVYAVKKIHLRYQNANGFLRSLKEVKMLACLNHPNIVAYKAAWLEPFDSRSAKHGQVTTVIVDDDNSDSSSDDNKKTDDSSDIVTFQKSKSKSKSSDYCRNDGSRSRKSNNVSRSVLNSSSTDSSSVGGVFGTDVDFGGGSNLAVCKFRHSVGRVHAWNFMQDSFKQDWATLFVQMQLCEENMRQWLDRRNRRTSSLTLGITDMEQCLSLFVKVLRGIEYIHDKGIVHHDIKPSNIFVSEDLNQVQVGDFGLACCLLTHSKVPFVPPNQSPEHKGRIGTKLYAAPEQANGVCSPKSDIYSVGIILLELIRPFQTEMERSKVISQLKRGLVSPELTTKWPDLVKVITQTVCSSPNKRPTARDLLKTISTKQKAAAMSGILCEKDELIRQLKEELATKNQEIIALKQKLASLGID